MYNIILRTWQNYGGMNGKSESPIFREVAQRRVGSTKGKYYMDQQPTEFVGASGLLSNILAKPILKSGILSDERVITAFRWLVVSCQAATLLIT